MDPLIFGFVDELQKLAMGARQDFTYVDRLAPKRSMGFGSIKNSLATGMTGASRKALPNKTPLAERSPPPPPVTTPGGMTSQGGLE